MFNATGLNDADVNLSTNYQAIVSHIMISFFSPLHTCIHVPVVCISLRHQTLQISFLSVPPSASAAGNSVIGVRWADTGPSSNAPAAPG